MMKTFFRIFLVAAFAVFVAGCGKDDAAPIDEPLGENPKLRAAVEAMAAEAPAVWNTLNGVEVWQEGYAPSGAWLNGSTPDSRHQVLSVTKTFTGMAVGIAVREGKLRLDDPIYELFKEEADTALASGLNKNLSESRVAHLKAVTVRDLLTMTCGHTTDPTVKYSIQYALSLLPYVSSSGIDVTGALNSLDLTLPLLFFAHPFNDEPGTNFTYNSLGSHMLAEIILKKTGENLCDYLNKRLFEPLGFEKPVWDEVQGTTAGGWGLHLNTDEMIRFGRLLLKGGEWDGVRLIPADFVKNAVAVQTLPRTVEFGYQAIGYGFQTWILPEGFMASGLLGQYIIVLPKKQAVIALTSDVLSFSQLLGSLVGTTQSEALLELTWKHLIPAL
ncbi:MAG: serine hydrolase domain-containing protein [Candidatus Cryptobacteroides sp.]|jgi:CubicO group peptidase (beta-lactamase class C family)